MVFSISLCEISEEHKKKLLVISHFVVLFCQELANIKYSDSQKASSKEKRVKFERMKLDEAERKKLEQQDLEEEIRKEKERDKRKYFKGKKLMENNKKIKEKQS